jgi:excisionase family DNA binding protein
MLPAQPLLLRMDDLPDALLTIQEVAKRAGISVSGVKRAVQSRELPAPNKIGERAARYRLADVQAWIANRGTKPSRPPKR